MTLKPKFQINDQVWTEDAYGRGGVMLGTIIGIQCTKAGEIRYMLSADQHQCHAHPEKDVFATQEEAWENWKDVMGRLQRSVSRHNAYSPETLQDNSET